MSSISARFTSAAVTLFLLTSGLGCACHGTNQFNVTVAMDDSVRQQGVVPRVEIDLVGVNNSDASTWSEKSMTDYFTPGDALRNSADHYIMRLDESSLSQTLKITDPKWDDWKREGAVSLYILSSYPRAADASGEADPRRRIIPLDCSRWDNVTDIKVLLKSGGLSVQTPPKPPPNQ